MKTKNILVAIKRSLAAAAFVSVAGAAPTVLAEGIIVQGSVTTEAPTSKAAGAVVNTVTPVVGEPGRGEGAPPMGGAPMGHDASTADSGEWSCQRIGGGLEYCEPAGATQGEEGVDAEARQTDVPPVLGDELPHDGSDMAFDDAGCQGGGSGTLPGALMAGLLGIGLMWRRRSFLL